MVTMSEGGFVWYELMTGDIDAAMDFYGKVVGWTMADAGMSTFRYTLAKAGGRDIAGIMGYPPEMRDPRPVWFGYILVSDVDSAAEKLKAEGGRVHRPPADIPGVGRFSVVSDPQGAVFMLFRGTGTPPPELAPGTPGTVAWHELTTSDWPEAFNFYKAMFGWGQADAMDMGPMGTYQMLSIAGEVTGGMMNGSHPPSWLHYFHVGDIDDAAKRITDGGGTILRGPQEVPGGLWIVVATDPQGATFAVTGKRG